jgi:hypothetical protein
MRESGIGAMADRMLAATIERREADMDAFKLAFETVLVGALALPWLWLAGVLMHGNLPCVARLLRKIVPAGSVPATVGVAAFSFAYLLGSAICPVAQEFLDDMDSIGFPTQDTIQARIVGSQDAGPVLSEGGPQRLTKISDRNAWEGERVVRLTGAIFRREESAILLTSAEASERLNRLHERLTILTGATFSGFTLAMLLVFAWCGARRSRLHAAAVHCWHRRGMEALTFFPCALIVFWGAWNLIKDWHKHSVDDPPIMEMVLLILGVFGLVVTATRSPAIAALPGKLLFVTFLTVLSYGGYLSTEPTYIHEVMDSYAAMTASPLSAAKGTHSAVTGFILAGSQDNARP